MKELEITLCLEEGSLLLGRDVLQTLGMPRQLQVLFNDEQQKLLLQSCSVEDREAVVIPPQPMLYFQVSEQALMKRVRKLTGWQDTLPRTITGFQIPGKLAIVFDLRTARIAGTLGGGVSVE